VSTPTITYANFRAIFNRKIGDKPVAVTTTTSSEVYDTAISTSLSPFVTPGGGGNYFKNWWLYVPSALESRLVESFDPVTGTVKVYRSFTAKILTTVAIELHKQDPMDKMDSCNDGLRWCSIKGHFFNPSYVETMWGQEGYGETTAEFNKRKYAVPTAFQQFPEIWLVEGYIGTHTGDDAAAVLTDSTKNWKTNELVANPFLPNKTDGSSTTVTSNTSTTATGALSGGTGDEWDAGDEYIIQKPDAFPFPLSELPNNQFVQTQSSKQGGYEFYAYIPEKYLIKLEGKGPLTVFSTEAGTTELYNEEAEIVALKCAALWYDFLGDRATSQDVAPLREKANRHHMMYEEAIGEARKPIQRTSVSIKGPW